MHVKQPYPLSYFVSINACNYPDVFVYYFAFQCYRVHFVVQKRRSLGSVLCLLLLISTV